MSTRCSQKPTCEVLGIMSAREETRSSLKILDKRPASRHCQARLIAQAGEAGLAEESSIGGRSFKA
eukprot:1797576-Amphidinium_carterae.1